MKTKKSKYKQYTLRVDIDCFAEKTVVAKSREQAAQWLFNNDWEWDFVQDQVDPWDSFDGSTVKAINDKMLFEPGKTESCVLLHKGLVIHYKDASPVNDPCITKHGIKEKEFFEIVNSAERENPLQREITKLERLRTELAKQEDKVNSLQRIASARRV